MKKCNCKVLTSVEAAELLKVSKTYINNLVKDGRLPCLIVGGKNLFFPEFLDFDTNKKIDLHSIHKYANITTKRMFNEDIRKFLGISETTLNKLYNQNEIAFVRISPRVKYVKSDSFIIFLQNCFAKCNYYKNNEEETLCQENV